MTDTNRRAFIGGLAVAVSTLATTSAQAGGTDGHAAGYDVAASGDTFRSFPAAPAIP